MQPPNLMKLTKTVRLRDNRTGNCTFIRQLLGQGELCCQIKFGRTVNFLKKVRRMECWKSRYLA